MVVVVAVQFARDILEDSGCRSLEGSKYWCYGENLNRVDVHRTVVEVEIGYVEAIVCLVLRPRKICMKLRTEEYAW